MSGEVLARHSRRPKGAGAAVRLPEHKAALEQAVLAAFTTKPPAVARRTARRRRRPGPWPRSSSAPSSSPCRW